MNAMPSFPLTFQRAGYSQQRWLGLGDVSLDAFYMAARLYPLTPKVPATPHVAYLGGTIYSASSENLVTTTTKDCKTFIIASCPFEWKATLTMKARTANMSGHRLCLTAGESCPRISRNTKSARDSLQSGSPQCSRSLSLYPGGFFFGLFVYNLLISLPYWSTMSNEILLHSNPHWIYVRIMC